MSHLSYFDYAFFAFMAALGAVNIWSSSRREARVADRLTKLESQKEDRD